jgi:N-carbamoyl-D-amino-acid hydrolase
MLELMRRAHDRGCDVVVFPELALTTFFPRWDIEDQEELDCFFEREMPGPETGPLFKAATRCRMGFYLGYAELAWEGRLRHFNTSILVDRLGKVVGKYRKVHLPGTAAVDPKLRFQHLEKRYFEVGDLGFPAWRSMGGVLGMLICNDRRWPEGFRVLGLQSVEMIFIGYNTPVDSPYGNQPMHLGMFQNHLCMQAGAYQNSAWVVGVAKAGVEDGHRLMGGSVIIAPSGEIVAQATSEDDELIVADCDLDACILNRDTIFNFAAHRRTEHYGLITERTGGLPPGLAS